MRPRDEPEMMWSVVWIDPKGREARWRDGRMVAVRIRGRMIQNSNLGMLQSGNCKSQLAEEHRVVWHLGQAGSNYEGLQEQMLGSLR